MSGLSEADREALALAASYGCGCWPDNPRLCESCRCSYGPTVEAVEQIVARHVTATWNAAIAVVEKPLLDAPNPSAAFQLWTNVHAADLKVAATPKPPEVVSRPQPRDLGE